ncbi:MAG: PAS domain-containing sensor histidine kinase [Chitinispirillaceae bacterium]
MAEKDHSRQILELEQELIASKEREAALREERQIFYDMVQSANSIILRMDPKGKITFFNDFACRFFGFKKEEILGKNVIGTIVPLTDSYGEDMRARIEGIGIGTDHYISTENENIRKDGMRVWVSWSNKPIVDKNGKVKEILCVGNDITRLKNAENALKNERDFANTIFETAGALQIVFDREGKIVRFNKTCEKLTGYTLEEVQQKPFWDLLLLPEEKDFVRKIADSLISSQTFSNRAENSWITREGNKRIISWYNTCLFDSNGNVEYVVSTGLDITDLRDTQEKLRKSRDHLEEMVAKRTSELSRTVEQLKDEVLERTRAEEALRDSERRYRYLFEENPSGGLIIGIDGIITDINSSFLRSLGYSREEAVGHHALDFIVPDEREKTVERISRRFNGEEVGEIESSAIAKDGSVHIILFSAGQTELYKDGRTVSILLTGIDITERKKAEEALRQSEQRYKFLFEESPAGNIIIGVDGIVKDVNTSFVKELGYEKTDLIGRPTLDFIVPEEREHVADVLKARARDRFIPARDNRIIAKDGSTHHIVFSGTQTLLYENGALSGILITGTDVTEARRAEALAKKHQMQLIQADKMASLGILVSGVAHEINNPNNFILLNSECIHDIWQDVVPLLDLKAQSDGDFRLAGLTYTEIREETDNLIKGIRVGADRIKRIVNSLKDFARQDPGNMDQIVNLNTVLDSAVLIMNNLIRKSTHHFNLELCKDLPVFRGNVQQIEQVIINLITNACQALTCQNQKITVSTFYQPESSQLGLSVSDEGSGIAQENIKYIMDPFFTTKRDSGGTGLGLSISYSIVKNHHGELTIQSEPGKGTHVRMLFPQDQE